MRTLSVVLTIATLFCAASYAEEPKPEPKPEAENPAAEAVKKFLKEAASAWYSARNTGMTSVLATAKLDTEGAGAFGGRGSGSGRFKPPGKLSGVEVDWTWSESSGEELRVVTASGGKAGAIQKLLKKRIEGLWRGVAGVPFDDLPENLPAELVDGEGEKEIRVTKKKKPLYTLTFSTTTKLPLTLEHFQGKRTTETTYNFRKVGEKLVLGSMEVSNQVNMEEKSRTVFTWDNFREVNERPLPTVAKVEFGENSITLRFTYTSINGLPAKVKEVTKKEVKDLAKILSTAFRKGSLGEKEEAIEMALDAGTDHAAKLLSAYIMDKEAGVAVVKALAKMGKKTAVSYLISAMGRSRKQVELHETIIWALGELGDAGAVKVLAKNIWGGAGGEGWGHTARIKIEALGKIRHHSAVDELVKMVDDGRRRWHGAVRKYVMGSLRKLTGQTFRSAREWKDWWKKNRSSFRF
ncbi:MAG: HEAT repeat domain-containing protein [Planctomycetota bacterium]|jgi:hypothetical protein